MRGLFIAEELRQLAAPSTARAHMAYHMLVRAGPDQARVERIEGHADRTPKDPKDKLAAPNRRIEILIKDRQT